MYVPKRALLIYENIWKYFIVIIKVNGAYVLDMPSDSYNVFVVQHAQTKAKPRLELDVTVEDSEYTVTMLTIWLTDLEKRKGSCLKHPAFLKHFMLKPSPLVLQRWLNSFLTGGRYILRLTSAQWVTLRNQGAFVGLNVEVIISKIPVSIFNL